MLNILNLKKNKIDKTINIVDNGNVYSEIRHYPPANKEWFNSIYAYNKDTNKSLPSADKALLKLIKSYFNLYSRKLLRKTKSRRLSKRKKRLSTNRILVSRAELKHTSDKVTITIYLYNRQRKYYYNRIKKLNTVFNFLRIYKKDHEETVLKKREKDLKLSREILNNVKQKVKTIMLKLLKERKNLSKNPVILSNFSSEKEINENIFRSYEKKHLKDLVRKCLDKEMLRLYFEQILLFNKFKFNEAFLLPFTKIIKNIYKKNIEFNLVNLKYLHLNSYIFTETLLTKLRNKKNRLLRVLRASLFKFKEPLEDKLATYDDIYNRKKIKQNLRLNNFSNDIKDKDLLQEMLEKISLNNFFKDPNLTYDPLLNMEKEEKTESILNTIKYKFVSGLRIEAAGRLTRRNTAARSVFKLRYKGNIRNLDSSYKGLSSVLLRGHAKPNVQYSKLKSKLRIGSYGIKGWVSSN